MSSDRVDVSEPIIFLVYQVHYLGAPLRVYVKHRGVEYFVFSSSSLLPLLEHRAEFPQFLDQGQSVGLLGRVISSSQGLYLYTNRKTHTHSQTLNIHALSEIRTHGPGFRATEDSARLTSLGN
jgi:hypothetical protein